MTIGELDYEELFSGRFFLVGHFYAAVVVVFWIRILIYYFNLGG
jgi:hypothetical protein